MLKICHVGWEFLTLKDAYLNYGCDAEVMACYTGMPLLETPSQRSLESFSCLLRRYNAMLISLNTVDKYVKSMRKWWNLKNFISFEQNDHEKLEPFKTPGMVCSTGYDPKEVISYLKRGGNVIIIKISDLISAMCVKVDIPEGLLKPYEELINILGINPQIDENNPFQVFVPYENGGKLIIVDGNTITDYGARRDDYHEILEKIIKEFLKFNIPVVSVTSVYDNMVVPLDTSIYVEWELTYWGNDGGDVEISIEVDKSIIPESPTTYKFSNLSYGEKMKVGFWFSPQSVGKFDSAVVLKANCAFPEEHKISLTVFPNYKNTIKSQSIAKSVLMEEFKKIYGKINIADFDKFIKLIEVDPRSAITKARYVAEKIAKKICINAGFSVENLTFEKMCKLIARENLLSKKGVGYLNTVRILGNLAAHAEEDVEIEFKEEDSLIVGQAIIEILTEVLNKNLIN